MSEEVEGKLISLAADILIDNLVQVNNNKVSQTLPRESLAFIQIWCHIFTCGEAFGQWILIYKSPSPPSPLLINKLEQIIAPK